jgi:hypothetical protein
MISCFDLTEEVLASDFFETDVGFVGGTTVDLSRRKDDRVRTILEAGED